MRTLNRLFAIVFALVLGACATAPPPSAPEPASPPASAPEAPASEPEAPAPAGDPLDDLVPLDSSLHKGTFDNGLTYLIRTNAKPEERADLWLVVDAGSLYEDEDQLGLAHFLEHMAFNGTKNFQKQELVDYLESIGMRFGAHVNAYTAFDETVYMLRVPTDEPEILETAFRILSDWAQHITLDPEEVDKERGVVIEEWRQGQGAQMRMFNTHLPVLFKGSRYAERLPIGTPEIIESAPPERLERYYRKWYRPELMALVAVGDFDPERIEELGRQYLGAIPATGEAPERPSDVVPSHDETLVSVATDPEATMASVSVYIKSPPAEQGRYRDYRRNLVEIFFNEMLNQRLAEAARQPKPPFLFAATGSGGIARSTELDFQVASSAPGELESTLAALAREVERVDRHGFTQGELDRIKAEVLRTFQKAYEERDKSDSRGFADELKRHFLEGEAVPGIARELEMVERFLPGIELDEVNALASQKLAEANRVILVNAPDREKPNLPSEDDLLATFEAVDGEEIAAYVDRTLEGPLVENSPTPGQVVEERELAEVGVTEWHLSNGVRVLLKPTDFKNDEIVMASWSDGGSSLVDDELATAARFATAVLGEGGAGRFDQTQLGKALAGKVVRAEPYIGELDEGITGGTSPDDLETLFELVYLIGTEPRADEDAFTSFSAKVRALLANRNSSPETVFFDRLGEVLSGDHPRRRPLSHELLDEVSLEDALTVYRERFSDFGDFTFAFVGNFDLETIRPLVERYLGGLPTSGREEKWTDLGIEAPEGVERFEVEMGVEQKSRVSLVFHGEAEWSPEGVHDVNSLAQVLQTRLREILREDLSGTYGARVQGNLRRWPDSGYEIVVGFGCAPENVDRLVEAIFTEVERLQNEGIESSYTSNVQEIQRRDREVNVRRNGFWLAVIQNYDRNGMPLSRVLEYDRLIERVTPERIQESASAYLDTDRYVLGVLLPSPDAPASTE